MTGDVDGRERCHGGVLVRGGEGTLGMSTTDGDVLSQTIVLLCEICGCSVCASGRNRGRLASFCDFPVLIFYSVVATGIVAVIVFAGL